MDPKPYEIIESVDSAIKYPGLYHEPFTLKIEGTQYLLPGVILALPNLPESQHKSYLDDLFVCVQSVDIEKQEIILTYLTTNKHSYVRLSQLEKGKRLMPMFSLMPLALRPNFEDWEPAVKPQVTDQVFKILKATNLTTPGLYLEEFDIEIEGWFKPGDRLRVKNYPREEIVIHSVIHSTETGLIKPADGVLEQSGKYRAVKATRNKNEYLHPKHLQLGSEWEYVGGAHYSETLPEWGPSLKEWEEHSNKRITHE